MESFEDNLFLKANLEKEIPILRAQIQNLYEQLLVWTQIVWVPIPVEAIMKKSIFIFPCSLSAMR